MYRGLDKTDHLHDQVTLTYKATSQGHVSSLSLIPWPNKPWKQRKIHASSMYKGLDKTDHL